MDAFADELLFDLDQGNEEIAWDDKNDNIDVDAPPQPLVSHHTGVWIS